MFSPVKATIRNMGISSVALMISGPAAFFASLKVLAISVPYAAFAYVAISAPAGNLAPSSRS